MRGLAEWESTDYFSTQGSVLGYCARMDGMGTVTESSSDSSSTLSSSRSIVSERGNEEEVVSNLLRNIVERQRRRGSQLTTVRQHEPSTAQATAAG